MLLTVVVPARTEGNDGGRRDGIRAAEQTVLSRVTTTKTATPPASFLDRKEFRKQRLKPSLRFRGGRDIRRKGKVHSSRSKKERPTTKTVVAVGHESTNSVVLAYRRRSLKMTMSSKKSKGKDDDSYFDDYYGDGDEDPYNDDDDDHYNDDDDDDDDGQGDEEDESEYGTETPSRTAEPNEVDCAAIASRTSDDRRRFREDNGQDDGGGVTLRYSASLRLVVSDLVPLDPILNDLRDSMQYRIAPAIAGCVPDLTDVSANEKNRVNSRLRRRLRLRRLNGDGNERPLVTDVFFEAPETSDVDALALDGCGLEAAATLDNNDVTGISCHQAEFGVYVQLSEDSPSSSLSEGFTDVLGVTLAVVDFPIEGLVDVASATVSVYDPNATPPPSPSLADPDAVETSRPSRKASSLPSPSPTLNPTPSPEPTLPDDTFEVPTIRSDEPTGTPVASTISPTLAVPASSTEPVTSVDTSGSKTFAPAPTPTPKAVPGLGGEIFSTASLAPTGPGGDFDPLGPYGPPTHTFSARDGSIPTLDTATSTVPRSGNKENTAAAAQGHIDHQESKPVNAAAIVCVVLGLTVVGIALLLVARWNRGRDIKAVRLDGDEKHFGTFKCLNTAETSEDDEENDDFHGGGAGMAVEESFSDADDNSVGMPPPPPPLPRMLPRTPPKSETTKTDTSPEREDEDTDEEYNDDECRTSPLHAVRILGAGNPDDDVSWLSNGAAAEAERRAMLRVEEDHRPSFFLPGADKDQHDHDRVFWVSSSETGHVSSVAETGFRARPRLKVEVAERRLGAQQRVQGDRRWMAASDGYVVPASQSAGVNAGASPSSSLLNRTFPPWSLPANQCVTSMPDNDDEIMDSRRWRQQLAVNFASGAGPSSPSSLPEMPSRPYVVTDTVAL